MLYMSENNIWKCDSFPSVMLSLNLKLIPHFVFGDNLSKTYYLKMMKCKDSEHHDNDNNLIIN